MPESAYIQIGWVLIAGFLVAVMQAGFTCLESGFVRAKNSINVAIKNLVDFCIASVLFTVAGFQVMFGPSIDGWFAWPTTARYESMDPWHITFFIFQLMFCGTAATIISGAVSERMRFSGYIFVTVVTAGLIYPTVGHWVWNGALEGGPGGWLGKMGFIDFAGSTVVHSVGGWVSLSAILVLGPRIGRFGVNGRPFEGHNLPMAVLGVFLLWFGFFGFNGGSTFALDARVPLIIANTSLAGAAGGLAGLMISWWLRGHSTVGATINGVVAGLVAICAACDIVGEVGAIVIGLGAGALAIAATSALERLRIDDVIGAVPAHLVAGAWGTLSVALFGDPAQLPAGNSLDQLQIQAFGVVAVGLFAMPLSLVSFLVVDRVMPFRVTADQERIGLNVSEHGATTSLVDLVTQMDRQARTGDFSESVIVEPETEADQVATFYNAVLEKFRDETRRRQEALERLGQLANTDSLTGLPNRRVFHEHLRRSLAACRRGSGSGGVLYLDLDGFKGINDTMGHEAGDHVLRDVAVRMSCLIREADMLAPPRRPERPDDWQSPDCRSGKVTIDETNVVGKRLQQVHDGRSNARAVRAQDNHCTPRESRLALQRPSPNRQGVPPAGRPASQSPARPLLEALE